MRPVAYLFQQHARPSETIEKAGVAQVDGWFCNVGLTVHRGETKRRQKARAEHPLRQENSED
jgi:hypothetical protein